MIKKSSNFSGLKRHRENARWLNGHAIRIGMLSNPDPDPSGGDPNASGKGYKGKSSGITVAQIGAIHELGLGKMPKRSFIGWVIIHQKAELADTTNEWLGALNKTDKIKPKQVLLAVAERYIGLSQERIRAGIPPKVTEATQKRKGGATTTLINRGQLINSIRAQIIKSSAATFLGGSNG